MPVVVDEVETRSLQATTDYTISQDYAAGHSAEQLRSLRGFHGEGNSNEAILDSTIGGHSLLSQHRRSSPPHISVSSLPPPPFPTRSSSLYIPSSSLTPPNFSLPAHHRAQELRAKLKARNTKRILLAGQEQETELEDRTQLQAERLEMSRKRQKLIATADDSVESLASTSAKPQTGHQEHVGKPARKSRVSERVKSKARMAESPSSHILATTGQGTNSRDEDPDHEAISSHFRILYKIDCKSSIPYSYHKALLFEDAPAAEFSSPEYERKQNRGQATKWIGEIHIEGHLPILSLEKYMEENSDIAFIILRRCQCPGRAQIRYEEIYIISSTLRSALHAVAQCYISRLPKNSYHSLNDSDTLFPLDAEQILQEPYLFLYHHRIALQGYMAANPEASAHVNALLAYASRTYGQSYREADSLFQRGVTTREHELTIYVPNDIVVKFDRDLGEPVAYVVQQWAALAEDGNLKLDCWYWQMDGVGMARRKQKWVLPRAPDNTEIEIGSLELVPLRFVNSDIHLRLKLRGQKHWSLRKQSYVSYKGWNKSKDQFYPDSRFMIDHRTFHRMHPSSEAFLFRKPDRLPFDPRSPYMSLEAAGSEDLYLLLPPDTHGFYFTEKKWINIFVDSIQPVTWNKTAYDRLVLPPETKDLVKALVTVRTSQRGVKQGLGLAGKREDIIAGKGNGLIMLLHGGPGTGKSLTAESVAEIAEMPLYRVTCGDVGTSVDMVERYLNNVLTLGKEWNCVLLLDEADVFLEERSMSDLKRNSLVSVFLRVLEYYDGILMLTSNRVGTFDEAFKSRIQVALYYEPLTRSSRKKIWQNFLDMLDEDEENVDFDGLRDRLAELAGHEMNGRQIRNTLTTARQLAIYRKEQLEWSHLERALSLSTKFNEYLTRVQGHTDAQWAKDEGIR